MYKIEYPSSVEILAGGNDTRIRAEINGNWAENLEIYDRHKQKWLSLDIGAKAYSKLADQCVEQCAAEAHDAYDYYIDREVDRIKE